MASWPPPFDLISLALLVDVVELGSISAAADANQMAQPSASARLTGLERRLGLVLLERSPAGTRPTEAGSATAKSAADVLAAVGRLRSGVEALAQASDETLHIAASYTVAELLLPTWLGRLRQRHPEVRTTSEVANSVRVQEIVTTGQATLGFVEGPRVGRGLRSQVVAKDRLLLIVAPTHPWAEQPRRITVDDLLAEPLVLRELGSGTRSWLTDWLARQHHREPFIATTLGSTTAVVQAVLKGIGPTVISNLAVSAELADGRLCEVAVKDLSLVRKLRAVWTSDTSLTPSAARLLEMASTGGGFGRYR